MAEAAATDTNTGLHKPATEQLNAMKLELKAKDEGILTLRALNEQLKVQAQNDREASEAKVGGYIFSSILPPPGPLKRILFPFLATFIAKCFALECLIL